MVDKGRSSSLGPDTAVVPSQHQSDTMYCQCLRSSWHRSDTTYPAVISGAPMCFPDGTRRIPSILGVQQVLMSLPRSDAKYPAVVSVSSRCFCRTTGQTPTPLLSLVPARCFPAGTGRIPTIIGAMEVLLQVPSRSISFLSSLCS